MFYYPKSFTSKSLLMSQEVFTNVARFALHLNKMHDAHNALVIMSAQRAGNNECWLLDSIRFSDIT